MTLVKLVVDLFVYGAIGAGFVVIGTLIILVSFAISERKAR